MFSISSASGVMILCFSANKFDGPSKTGWEWSHYQAQTGRTQQGRFFMHLNLNTIQDLDAFTPACTVEEDLSATVAGRGELVRTLQVEK